MQISYQLCFIVPCLLYTLWIIYCPSFVHFLIYSNHNMLQFSLMLLNYSNKKIIFENTTFIGKVTSVFFIHKLLREIISICWLADTSSSSASIQSISQPDRHPVSHSASKSASEPPSQSVRHPVSQSICLLLRQGGGSQTGPLSEQRSPRHNSGQPQPPYNGPPHKGPHTGTIGRSQSGGGRRSWGYPPAHFRTRPPPSYLPYTHAHTHSPHLSSFKEPVQVSSCVSGTRRKQGDAR